MKIKPLVKYYLPVILTAVIALARFYFICTMGVRDCKKISEIPEIPFLTKIRTSSIDIVDKNFPSPQSELLLGMLIGLDRLGEVPNFSDKLKDTSTIHVVVVSGFNIALVFNLVTKALGSEYRFKNLVIAQLVTVFYALLSGFEPPVVRALVMGSIVSWGKYSGRLIDGMRVLIFAASVMIIIEPAYLSSVSFQLSFMASLGLILFSGMFANLKVPEDLKSTFAAQLLVWPIISIYFGRVSVIGIVVNPLILWTVPISTILGGAFLAVGFVSPILAKFFALAVYPFLDIFFKVVDGFGSLKNINVNLKITPTFFALYYLLIFSCVLFLRKMIKSKHESKTS